jgi:hypothetical protein
MDDAIIRDAQKLATAIAPERDLWPGIESAITASEAPRRSYTTWFAQAAAVILLIGGSSAVTYLVTKPDTDVVNGAPVASNVEVDAEFASFGENHELSASFTSARSNLEAELDFELDRLSPEARATVEENLAIIRGAIREINAELAADPNNELLQELLLESYREELAVMRDVSELTRDVMSRNDI